MTSNAGASSEKLTYSSRALPEWLEIGKIDVNAACRPSFLRASGRRVRLQERAVRRELRFEQERHLQGTLARLAKLLRMRFFSVNEYGCAGRDFSRLPFNVWTRTCART